MLNFEASKPRVKGGPGPRPPWIRTCHQLVTKLKIKCKKNNNEYLSFPKMIFAEFNEFSDEKI